jgi:hypothetical protein
MSLSRSVTPKANWADKWAHVCEREYVVELYIHAARNIYLHESVFLWS